MTARSAALEIKELTSGMLAVTSRVVARERERVDLAGGASSEVRGRPAKARGAENLERRPPKVEKNFSKASSVCFGAVDGGSGEVMLVLALGLRLSCGVLAVSS